MDCEIDYGDCDADDKPQKRFVFKKKKKAITKDGKQQNLTKAFA